MATVKGGHEDITMSIHVHVCLSSKLCLNDAGYQLDGMGSRAQARNGTSARIAACLLRL